MEHHAQNHIDDSDSRSTHRWSNNRPGRSIERALTLTRPERHRSPADSNPALPGGAPYGRKLEQLKKSSRDDLQTGSIIFLKKQDKTIDRVFLGMETPGSLTLESNSRLTGNGEFRTSKGWQDFTFTCNVSPETGKVTAFQPVLKH